MGYIICDSAPANWGKTTTLLEVAKLFKSNQSLYTISSPKTINGIDEWLVVKVKATNKIIIVQTQGDNASAFQDTENYLKRTKNPVDIIICASRSSGNSYQKVLDIANSYGYKRIMFSNFCPMDRTLFSNTTISQVNLVDLAPIIVKFAISL